MPNSFEKLTSKAAGKAKGAAAALKGLTGVFNLLAQQHAEASALLTRARASTDPEKRRDLWSKIRAELLSHEKGERQVVYPELRRFPETQLIADEHDREAGELEMKIHQVDGADPASDAWAVKLDELIAFLQQHVDEEENEFFPKAIDVLGDEAARDLTPRFMSAKKTAAGEPA